MRNDKHINEAKRHSCMENYCIVYTLWFQNNYSRLVYKFEM